MTDWHLLAVEPAPGHPATVREVAQRYRAMATHAQDALDGLTGLESGFSSIGWTGNAASTVHQRLHMPIGDLRLVTESHTQASQALGAFASAMESVQARASSALNQANGAERTRSAARTEESAAEASRAQFASTAKAADRQRLLALGQAKAATLAGSDPTPFTLLVQKFTQQRDTAIRSAAAHQATRDRARSRAEGAVQQLAQLRRQAQDLHHEFLDAARRCQQLIAGAADMAVRESWIQMAIRAAKYAGDVVHQGLASEGLENYLAFLTVVASVASVLAFVPGLGLVAGAVALGANAVIFVTRYFQACNGTVGWDKVGGQAVALVFSGLAFTKVMSVAAKAKSGMTKVDAAGKTINRTGTASQLKRFLHYDDARHAKGVLRAAYAAPKMSQSNPVLLKNMQTIFPGASEKSIARGVAVLEAGKTSTDLVESGSRIYADVRTGNLVGAGWEAAGVTADLLGVEDVEKFHDLLSKGKDSLENTDALFSGGRR